MIKLFYSGNFFYQIFFHNQPHIFFLKCQTISRYEIITLEDQTFKYQSLYVWCKQIFLIYMFQYPNEFLTSYLTSWHIHMRDKQNLFLDSDNESSEMHCQLWILAFVSKFLTLLDLLYMLVIGPIFILPSHFLYPGSDKGVQF